MSAPRFLLVRFSAIGDCVMAAWAATSIRQRYPDAFICWAIQARCAPVVDRHQLATRVWEMPRDRWKRHRWSPKTWQEQVVYYARLRQLRFDFGIDLQGHFKTALCLRLSGATKRIAARGTDAIALRMNPIFGAQPAELHTVEWNHRVLCSLGDFDLPERPIMPQREEATAAVREVIPLNRPLATISVGAGALRKTYPATSWKQVADELVADGYQVAFLGGPDDAGIDHEGTTDLVGKLPLAQSFAAVQSSAIHLAGDTGSGHIAAAYGVPVVSIFGPTNPTVFRPYTKNGLVVCDGPETSSVTPERVVRAARELVGKADAAFSD